MRLLVIRHARAGTAEEFARTGEDDDLRPLSPAGRREMKEAAAGLRALVDSVDLVATSPLVRARQTAEIVGAVFDHPEIVETDSLRPDAHPSAFAEWVGHAAPSGTVAIIGHRPGLHELTSWLLAGISGSFLKIRKGGALMLDLPASRADAGSATLLWSLTPDQLHRMAP